MTCGNPTCKYEFCWLCMKETKPGHYENTPCAGKQFLDTEGFGSFVKMATEKGKAVQKDLKCGICGEHGGDPKSIQFADKIGLDYVSCSPFRIPIARLAAAQAVVLNKQA